MSTVDLKDFLAGYLVEVDEHLRAAGTMLLDLERQSSAGGPTIRIVRELLRAMHTVKGLSAMVGIDPIVEISHAMEAAMRQASARGASFDPPAIDLMVGAVRAIEARVRAVGAGHPVPDAPRAIVDALAALADTAAPTELPAVMLELGDDLAGRLHPDELRELAGPGQGRRALRVDFYPSPAGVAAGINITRVRERISALGDIIKVVPLSVGPSLQAPSGIGFAILVVTAADEVAIGQAAHVDPAAVRALAPLPTIVVVDPLFGDTDGDGVIGDGGQIVRVPVARLDDAMERLSALIVTRFRLTRAVADLAATGADVRELSHIMQEAGRQLRDLRASIMRARMVAVTELLERVPLIVRGLARTTGKDVRLEIHADRAELDKAVGEQLFPAIVQLVRNAVDHAIEPPEERVALGKPATGTIRVECYERANNRLELQVSDDGRGIDPVEVARRAGRDIPATPGGLLSLLVLPGLSTRDHATTTSGRGIGMDIVQRIAVDQLGGELLLATELGAGTTFTLRVPLTIAIVDAFSFWCGGQSFVVPVAMVEEIVDVDPAALRRPPRIGDGIPVALLDRRGHAIPIVDLETVFSLAIGSNARRKAILVRRNGQQYAFAVDRMLGQQEVVIRPVDDPLVKAPGVAGSTDLGDGRPTLVVDLVALSATIAARGGLEVVV